MSRYIDADVMRDEWLYESGTFEPNDVLDSIDCQPTVDAVPVEWIKNYVKRLEENGNTFAVVQYEMMLDEYFADGERKDGERRTE